MPITLFLRRIYSICLAVWLASALVFGTAAADSATLGNARFFHSGNGWINLRGEKTGAAFRGNYRLADGRYDPSALKVIYRIFDAPYDPGSEALSLRLIEYLDFLEDRLSSGSRITVLSGYRSPTYNTLLRKRGKLAARASLHQYGMAADLKMDGVPAGRIWNYVKALGFGGAGYYHGDSVHIDVGPARFWDEKTSGVGTDISSNNKLIGLVASRDIYLPGELLNLRFIRMTLFPIGVSPEFILAIQKKGPEGSDMNVRFRPRFYINLQTFCPQFKTIEQMTAIRWRIPKTTSPGRYRVRAQFCSDVYEGMPEYVTTPEIQIGRIEE